MAPVRGPALPKVAAVEIAHRLEQGLPAGSKWALRGRTEPEHLTIAEESARLASVQPVLGREGATAAALIPIRKSADWWSLSPARRREIFADRSRHIVVGLEYLPAVARRLYHSRALGEPFDFLTWFEFAPEHAPQFEDLVGRLRETEEWTYVIRELDVRLRRAAQPPG
jgi:hypothetical protein